MVHEPAVLIEGVLFRARYLGSTQMTCDGRPTKASRMGQAQEAVARVKAPEGEIQPSTEIDLFISTEKIMVLNTDLQVGFFNVRFTCNLTTFMEKWRIMGKD